MSVDLSKTATSGATSGFREAAKSSLRRAMAWLQAPLTCLIPHPHCPCGNARIIGILQPTRMQEEMLYFDLVGAREIGKELRQLIFNRQLSVGLEQDNRRRRKCLGD